MVAESKLIQSTHRVPPLENGDRLSREEFERRYAAMPANQKAELIEGVVYMASPLRFQNHAEPHSNLIGWLWTYRIATPGIRLGIEPTVLLDLDNEPQPDAVLLFDEAVGGRARLTEDDYVEGAPELVIEVAASSAGYDLHDKKRAYRRNGVQEYIVWQIYENKLHWFRLQSGKYRLLEEDDAGVVKSQAFPGLWLAVPELLQGNMAQVLAVLQLGIASAEHKEFVKALQQP